MASIIVSTTPQGDVATDLQVTPDGKRLIAVAPGRVIVVDTATNTVIGSVDLPRDGSFRRLTVSDDGQRVYVAGALSSTGITEITLTGPASAASTL